MVSSGDFSGATALDFIGDWLYAAYSDGKLYRFPAPDGKIQYDNRQLVDNGDTIDWGSVGGLFSTAGSGPAFPPVLPSEGPGPDQQAPRTRVKKAPPGVVRAGRVLIKGRAFDDTALRKVEVQVKRKVIARTVRNGHVVRRVKKGFLRANRTWRSKPGFFTIKTGKDLGTRTGWRTRLKLIQTGNKVRYTVKVRAVDASGNVERTPAKVKFITRGR